MGTYYNSIDSKNRMIVPSKLRDELGAKCVLVKSADSCLNIYSEEGWNARLQSILEHLPETKREARAIMRSLTKDAVQCEFDKQGRIVIPQDLIRQAGIVKDLVTMGVMNKIEVWGRETWEAPDNEGRIDPDDFADIIEKYDF